MQLEHRQAYAQANQIRSWKGLEKRHGCGYKHVGTECKNICITRTHKASTTEEGINNQVDKKIHQSSAVSMDTGMSSYDGKLGGYTGTQTAQIITLRLMLSIDATKCPIFQQQKLILSSSIWHPFLKENSQLFGSKLITLDHLYLERSS